jgi:hypothetical protein
LTHQLFVAIILELNKSGNNLMEKLIRDGKVAVVYSPGYGAGWYTWNRVEYGEELIFDPVLAAYVDENKMSEAHSYIAMRFPQAYTGGVEDLSIQWIPQGTAFRIHEYDGSESIEIKENLNWVIA